MPVLVSFKSAPPSPCRLHAERFHCAPWLVPRVWAWARGASTHDVAIITSRAPLNLVAPFALLPSVGLAETLPIEGRPRCRPGYGVAGLRSRGGGKPTAGDRWHAVVDRQPARQSNSRLERGFIKLTAQSRNGKGGTALGIQGGPTSWWIGHFLGVTTSAPTSNCARTSAVPESDPTRPTFWNSSTDFLKPVMPGVASERSHGSTLLETPRRRDEGGPGRRCCDSLVESSVMSLLPPRGPVGLELPDAAPRGAAAAGQGRRHGQREFGGGGSRTAFGARAGATVADEGHGDYGGALHDRSDRPPDHRQAGRMVPDGRLQNAVSAPAPKATPGPQQQSRTPRGAAGVTEKAPAPHRKEVGPPDAKVAELADAPA